MTESGDEQLRTIDEILAVLRSPARAEELDGEEEMVDAMAAMVIAAHDEEPAPMHSRSRPLKLGVLAGAAVLSLAGVAAATGVLPDRTTTPPKAPTIIVAPTNAAAMLPQDSTTISVARAATTATAATAADTSTTVPAVTAAAAAAAAAPTVSAPPCPPDVVNHGDYVSRVARDTPPGPDHGAIVSAAAQSDCGKPNASPASTSPVPAPAGRRNADHTTTGHGNGNGNGGHGHGHG